MIKNIFLGGQFYIVFFYVVLVECFLKVSLCASLFFGVSLFDTLACYNLPRIFLKKKKKLTFLLMLILTHLLEKDLGIIDISF